MDLSLNTRRMEITNGKDCREGEIRRGVQPFLDAALLPCEALLWVECQSYVSPLPTAPAPHQSHCFVVMNVAPSVKHSFLRVVPTYG